MVVSKEWKGPNYIHREDHNSLSVARWWLTKVPTLSFPYHQSQYITLSSPTTTHIIHTILTGDIKAFPSRVRGDISEIDLDGCGPEGRIDVSTAENVTSYLRGCSSRVDVILDPSHNQLWYPYWEGDTPFLFFLIITLTQSRHRDLTLH